MTIAGFLNAVRRINTDRAIDDSLEQTRPELLRLNKEQMMRGENAKGGRIGRYRNPAYAARKNAMNPLAGFGNVDLNLTGDFQRGLFADIRQDVIVLGSTDEKTMDLVKRYPFVFGLTDDGYSTYRRTVRPVFFSTIKKQINGR